MNKKALILTLALALPASLALAQRPGGPPPGGQPPRGPAPGGFPPGPPPNQQPGGGDANQPRGKRPPKEEGDRERPNKPPLTPVPLMRTLDPDQDGILSAAEIEKAPEALSKLDKNKDGKLMPDEFMAPPPAGQPGGDRRERDTEKPRQRGDGDKKEGERPFPGQKPPRDGDKREGERPFPGQKPPRDGDRNGEGGGKGNGDREDEGERRRPQAPPLVAALDADHNGVITAAEISDSSKSLLALDKNGDGQLGPVEYLGRPPGERHEGDGPKPPREGDGPRPPREGDGPKPPPPAPEEQ